MSNTDTNDRTTDVEYRRPLRRAAQREQRAKETSDCDRKRKDAISRRIARASLPEEQRITITRANTTARSIQRASRSMQ